MRQYLEQTWMDARVGARSLFRDRTFTVVAVLTLAVGVALNATMFSVANAILFRPPPFARPEQLVIIDNQPPAGALAPVSTPEFLDYRRQSKTTTQLAMIQGFNANITGGDRPDRVDAVAVSPNFFILLGVPPLLGRTFVPADEQPGFTEIAVISYGVWQRIFGGSRDAIGKKIRLDDDNYTIVGVMPKDFKHPIDAANAPVEVWLPAGFMGAPWPTTPVRSARFAEIIGRLAPNASIADARHEFDRINSGFVATYPADYGAAAGASKWQIAVRPLADVMARNSGKAVLLLLGAVMFVLLVACTNVASLVLARGAARRTEVAVRAAIGADRGRLVRSLLVEHMVLAATGGVAGVLLAFGGVGAVRALAPVTLPRRDEIVMDWRVLLFVLACSMLAGILVGVLPAVVGARTPISDVLKAGGRSAMGGASTRRSRSALVVIELALSVLLLAGAGIVARSFWNLQRVDLGFEPDHLLTAEVTVSLPNDRSQGKYVDPPARAQYFEEIVNRLKTIPGVQHVAGTNAVPLRDPTFEGAVTVEGRPEVAPTELPRVTTHPVTADYFAAVGTPIVSGVGITEQDRAGAPINVVLSQTAAKRLFPNENPIGKRLKRGPAASPAPWMTVVGVAADAKLKSADADPESSMYVSMLQVPSITLALLVRSGQEPAALGQQLVNVVHSVDKDQPVYRVVAMNTVVTAATGERRFAAWLFVAFAVLSLGLAAVGVYGLVAQSVAYRRREIGLRMALGAAPPEVVWLIVRDALVLAGTGAVLGVGLALSLTHLLQSQLFGISARDPLVFAGLAPVLLIVVAAASYLPGRAASRLNPVAALRAD